MATEAEIIASNVLASAIEYKRLYDTTKKNEYKVKEQRLRQIAENVKLIVSSTSSSSVSSFNGRTGAVTLLGSDVTSALGYTPLASESDTLDSVTDRGSTTPNAINVGGITTDYVQFDTIATPTPVVGMMSWDTDRSTVSVQLDSDVDAHLGQDNFWYVKNQSGATIPKGKAVMAVGTLGASGRILIDEMVANGSVSAKYLLGVTAEDIANGADGFVINIGKLRQTDTSVWPDGTVLYCDASTPGNLTSTKPSSPNLALPIAFVVHSATNGILAIRISTIDENSLGGGSVPTLAQVTTAGNTTTNAISVGGLTISKVFSGVYNEAFNFNYTSSLGYNSGSISFNQNYNKTAIGISNGTSGTAIYQSGINFYLETQNVGSINYISRNHTFDTLLASGSVEWKFQTVSAMKLFATGNLTLGYTSPVDAGYKLDVKGSTAVRGSLLVTDTNGNLWTAISGFDNNEIAFTGSRWVSGSGTISYLDGQLTLLGGNRTLAGNQNIIIANVNGNVPNSYITLLGNGASLIYSNRTRDIVLVTMSTTIPSGSSNISYNSVNVSPNVNYSGVTGPSTFRGLYYNPTLTGFIGEHEAIRTASGKIIHQGLTNATQTSQVYYNTATGELTYGALPTVATPTLAQVTTAGNTTTNAVTVGGLTVTGMIEVFKVGSSVEFRSLDSNINFLGKSDNTGGVNFYGGGAYNTGGGISVTGNSNLNPSSIYFFRDAFTQNGRFFSSGNLLLGSGSTDAGYKLDVSGTIRSSGVITASGGTSTDWNAAYSWGNHATAGYLTGTTGYTGIFTVPTNPPGQQNLDIVNGLIVNVF